MKLFINKIDMLVAKKERLSLKAQKIQDKMHEKNSTKETKISILENKSFRAKQEADAKIAEITRQLDKIAKQIQLEKDYYNAVGGENE